MKSVQVKGWSILLVGMIAGTLLIASNNSAVAQAAPKDTVPAKQKKIKDLDEALLELEKAQLEVEKSLKNIDWKKIEVELQESMKKLDMDMARMKIDIEKSIKEIDFSKMKMEFDSSMAKIDWQKIEKDMEKLKDIDLGKIKIDLDKMQPEIDKAMKDAEKSIEKARVELKEYKTFLDGLEKEGLIDQKKDYTIEHKNSQLIINGKVQPQDVYNRYRAFLEKHKEISIRKTADDFDIDHNND